MAASGTHHDADLLDPLSRWFEATYPDRHAVTCRFAGTPKAGLSNDTCFVTMAWTEHGTRSERAYVLRRPNKGAPIHPLQTNAVESSIVLQYDVMKALRDDGSVAIAPILPFEADPRWLGVPFYLMEFVPGWVPSDFPSYNEEGPYVDAAPAERRAFVENGLAQLAAIHCVDWRRAGLGWLDRAGESAPRMPAQLALWRHYCAPIFAQTPFPTLARALAWLETHLPPEPEPALVWGDARPHNMVYDNRFRPIVVMDWEGAAILPPERDIAYWLVNDRLVHERLGIGRRPGTPTREEQVAFYCERLGRPVSHIDYYCVFAAMTIAATIYNVFTMLNRDGVLGGADVFADDNAFSALLGTLMDEASRH